MRVSGPGVRAPASTGYCTGGCSGRRGWGDPSARAARVAETPLAEHHLGARCTWPLGEMAVDLIARHGPDQVIGFLAALQLHGRRSMCGW